MAYADSNEMSRGRLISIILVMGLHIFLGYALVTGLAHEAIEKVASTMTAVDVEEEIPEEEPPPPEEVPETVPPPVFVPPPPVAPPPRETQVTTVNEAPPAAPPTVIAAPPSPPPPVIAPPPPPPPVSSRPKPVPRGNTGRWANANDYPSRALREEREGTTRFSVTVNAKGRVENCSVTRSSGHADLDAATCKNITRRARFRPALDPNDNPISGKWASRVKWEIPQ